MITGSTLCNKGELDLYSIPPTLTTMDRAFITEHQPLVSPGDNTAPIEFIIPRQTEKWTDLMDLELNLKIQMLKGNGDPIVDANNVSIIDNPLHSLFSHVDIYINGKLISGNDKYPYRAYFETLCGSSETEQNMLKDTQMWSKAQKDDLRNYTVQDGADAIVSGQSSIERHDNLIKQHIVELQGKLHTDITRQSKYLPNMCELKIRLVRSSPAFYMIGDDSVDLGAKIKIIKAVLKVRTVSLDPNVWISLNNALRSAPMKIPIKRVDINVFTVMNGLVSKIESNLIHGQIPKRIIIGQVRNSVMNGSKTESPFSFEHFDISKLKITVNGTSIDANPLKMNFSSKNSEVCQSYRSFWKGLGIEHGKDLYVFPISVYKANHTLWAVDFTPELGCEEGHLYPIKNGNIEFDMEWSKPLP